jgi:hypothetical protein
MGQLKGACRPGGGCQRLSKRTAEGNEYGPFSKCKKKTKNEQLKGVSYPMTQQTLLDFTSPGIMDTIRRAEQQNKVLSLAYKDSKGDVTERSGEPYEIKDGGLYMYCYLRNSIRLFKLSNIMSAKVTNQTFVPKFPMKI